MATVFTAPYASGDNPTLPPYTRGNGATTSEGASADPRSGELTLSVAAMVTLNPGKLFPVQATAATAAKPFLINCFKTPPGEVSRSYTVRFDCRSTFEMLLQAGRTSDEQHVSRAIVQVIGEVFDADNNLVADTFTNIFQEQALDSDIGPVLVSIPRKQIELTADLKPATAYYWKFSFYAGVCTGASGKTNVSTTCSCNADPVAAAAGGGAPGFRGTVLNSVTINPDVTPVDCADYVEPSTEVALEIDVLDVMASLGPEPAAPVGGTAASPGGGIDVVTNPDGTIIVTGPDGSKTISRPNGTTIFVKPDGTTVVGTPGTTIVSTPGSTTAVPPGGPPITVTPGAPGTATPSAPGTPAAQAIFKCGDAVAAIGEGEGPDHAAARTAALAAALRKATPQCPRICPPVLESIISVTYSPAPNGRVKARAYVRYRCGR